MAAILKYHVVAGRVYSDQALAAGDASTLLDQEIHILADENGARVNNSNLVATDIDASNGVIHVIDTVLIPEAENAATGSVSTRKRCPLSQRSATAHR